MRILLALDKFKGSLTAKEACDAVARGLRRIGCDGPIEICPIADGGEGFTEAVITALGGEWCSAPVHDAQGREVIAHYGIILRNGHREAVMEMSAASGLAMVSDLPLNPRTASTRGTGEMMSHAMKKGARRILIGIGGSATNDAGTGMAVELGCKFYDESGAPVSNLPVELERVHSIGKCADLACDVVVACDVSNSLLGEHGCSAIYGPQKGVDDVAWFDARLRRLSAIVHRDLGSDYREEPGAGAAGGLGYGLMTFCGATLQSGFDLVSELTGLRERLARADLVITGEGRLDAQTLDGKGPIGVAALARRLGVRVIGIGGLVDDNETLRASFDAVIQAKPSGMPLVEAVARAAELLENAVVHHSGLFAQPRAQASALILNAP
ncbi:MAG: glycerate kinase [Roseimicrobium sp.]